MQRIVSKCAFIGIKKEKEKRAIKDTQIDSAIHHPQVGQRAHASTKVTRTVTLEHFCKGFSPHFSPLLTGSFNPLSLLISEY